MYNVRKLTDDLTWIGGIDRKITKFENVYKLNSGMNYNSYFLDSGATVLFDTVGRESADVFFENLKYCLDGRRLDYVVIHHMEPDHSATLAEVLDLYADAKIVVNAKTLQFISQFFPDKDYSERAIQVKDGDELELGDHRFRFVFAPMVHWPEVMMSYDETEGTLFSADAFGSYGAVNGSIFADGKDFEKIIGCYKMWGSYTPEVKGVFILAGSIYGHTANAAEVLMTELDKRGIGAEILDASAADISDIIAMAFKYSHIVIATPTYNNGIYSPVEHAVNELAAHGLNSRSFSVIENGTWAPSAGKALSQIIEKMKNCRMTGQTVTVRSSGNSNTRLEIEALADAIIEDIGN